MRRVRYICAGFAALLLLGAMATSADAASQGGTACGASASNAISAGKGKKVKAVANIQSGNYFCGENEPELAVRGSVDYTRVGNVVSLKVKVTHGEPNTEYKVQLAEDAPAFCDLLAGEFSFKTNSKGKGKADGSFEVPAEGTEFFADVDTAGWYGSYEGQGDTPKVALP